MIDFNLPRYTLIGDPRHQKGAGKNYVQRYRIGGGKVQTVSLKTTDLRTARRLAQTAVEDKIRAAIVEATPEVKHAETKLDKHITSYEAWLENEGDAAKHIANVGYRLRALLLAGGLNLQTAAEITEENIKAAVAKRLRAEEIGQQTSKHILVTAKAFTGFLRKTRRLATDPLIDMVTSKGAILATYKRRAPTDAEFKQLLTNATKSKTVYRELTGADRAMVYQIARATGYRSHELSSITPDECKLDGNRPGITIPCTISKRRQNDFVPIAQSLATQLRSYIKDRPADEPLWPSSWWVRSNSMLSLDMGSKEDGTEIKEKTKEGRVTFHSLRHSFITRLAKTKAPLTEIMAVGRLSTPALLVRYAHDPEDQGKTALVESISVPEMPKQTK